jgi:trehalose-phosphatase
VTDRAFPDGIEGVASLWKRVAEAPERYLVLDYDGTLAPFRVNRMEAAPVDGAMEALLSIRDSGATMLSLLTGRPIRELLELVGDLGVPMAGSHGAELLMPGGSIERVELSRVQEERFHLAEQQARRIAPRARVERKPASVGLHTRGMPEAEAAALHAGVMEAWSTDLDGLGLESRRFSGGVELRLVSTHKGTALKRLLEGRSNGSLCVYIGDDETDEDAFEALPEGGIGIKVGPPGIRTRAQGRLDDPRAVRRFLEKWAAMTR